MSNFGIFEGPSLSILSLTREEVMGEELRGGGFGGTVTLTQWNVTIRL